MNKNFHSLLASRLPIIQAPMAGVQGSELAIAVSQAGGLGSLPCAMLSNEQIVKELQLITAATDQPINLNFFCHQPAEFNEEKQTAWQNLLKPYFDELGISPTATSRAQRVPFSHAIADVIEPFKPKIISFHFGLPEQDLLARVKSWGTKVISSATTVEEALWLEAQGVDGIIAQGVEAGGHRGMFLTQDITSQIGLMPLLEQLVKRVKVPVIAAGGIASAKSVKACLDLGAAAVQVGTAFLLCPEVKTTPLHRQALQSDAALHTALTNVFTGKPARGIANRVMQELGYMPPLAPDFPYASIEMGQLRQAAEEAGNTDFSPLWCGQNAQGCQAIPAAELTKQLAADLN